MKKFLADFGLWLLLALLVPYHVFSQNAPVSQVSLRDFRMQSAYLVSTPGDSLSDARYRSPIYWFPVKVPTTVLSGLVANRVYPDPYISMNNMLIPDASDSFNKQYHLGKYSFLPGVSNPWNKPYWFRTSFLVPSYERGRYFQLIFKGINYRAAVWVNGHQIADSSLMAGMFAQYSLDVSRYILPGQANGLAAEIYPLDYPGLPSHPQLNALGDFYANGGPTGDIGKNVTMLCSVGWDWIPAVRDRNMGIWQPVLLRSSGPVTLERPHVITRLPDLPDTNTARIHLHFRLKNHSDLLQSGNILITISPQSISGPTITYSRPIRLPGDSSLLLDLGPAQVPSLQINHPHLWWPNGYGNPDLYRIRFRFQGSQGISDDTSFLFGIRTTSSRDTLVNGWARRFFYVNGRKIHLVGGAWVPDMMLNMPYSRLDGEMRLYRNDHLNLLRIWGGGIAPSDLFFHLADRYGMLVWQDFWVTGDTQGTFKGSPDWPLEGRVYIDNMISTIYRLRNHASLLLWTGGNEGHAREELYRSMREHVAGLDGTRPFIPGSSGFDRLPKGWNYSWPDNQPSGVYSSGPYSWQDPQTYYRLVDAGRDWGFKDEVGMPSQPVYQSLPKMIPDLVPDPKLPFPLNDTWGYHDACQGNGKYGIYYHALVRWFGAPASLKDYCQKAQLLNADGYRAIFEAADHKLNTTGGVLLWKLNAAFPSVMWEIFDWYLEPNAGYYAIQDACAPLHVQMDLDDSVVTAVNRTYRSFQGLREETRVLDLSGRVLYHQSSSLNLGPSSVRSILPLSGELKAHPGISFVELELKDSRGKLLSKNVYWEAPGHDFSSLSSMKPASLTLRILNKEIQGKRMRWTLKLSNPTRQLAFFIRAQLDHKGREVLPAIWSANFITLRPGTSQILHLSVDASQVQGGGNQLEWAGWNVSKTFTGL